MTGLKSWVNTESAHESSLISSFLPDIGYNILIQMSRSDNILNILAKEFCSSEEILVALTNQGLPISKATLKRDLKELLEKNLINKTGKAKATKYSLSPLSQLLQETDIKKYFQVELDKRDISNSFNFKILDLLLEHSNEILSSTEITQINILNAQYQNAKSQYSETLTKKTIENFSIDFAWKSSRIEGNAYTILEAETLIKTGRTAGGKTKDDAVMLLNHKTAMDYIFENPKYFENIDKKKVFELHQILTKELNISSGIRRRIVVIGGTKYKPLDNPFTIEEALSTICLIINRTVHPAAKAILASILIAYLQAFEDGNKRSSRVVANAVLLAYSFCPVSYRNLDETEYKKAIVLFYEQNKLSYFKQLFLEQFEFAVGNYWL